MISIKMQKIISLKLNGLRAHGQDIKPERGKDKRGVTGYDIKKLKIISEKINTIPKEVNIHKNYCKSLRK